MVKKVQNPVRSIICLPVFATVGYALSLRPTDGTIGPHDAPSSEFDVECLNVTHCACPNQTMTVYDARALEAFENTSKVDFFHRHGFVLLTGPVGKNGAMHANGKQVMETLFPDNKILIDIEEPGFIRTDETQYSWGSNHQDNSLNASGYDQYSDKWYFVGNSKTLHPNFDFVYRLNFWGPIGMKEPLMYAPLALKDPHTADVSEFLPDTKHWKEGVDLWQGHGLCQSKNKWYYYPNMLNNEFIVFTHFQHHQGDEYYKPYMRSNMHGAFDNPLGHGREHRKSTERRLTVLGCRTASDCDRPK